MDEEEITKVVTVFVNTPWMPDPHNRMDIVADRESNKPKGIDLTGTDYKYPELYQYLNDGFKIQEVFCTVLGKENNILASTFILLKYVPIDNDEDKENYE